MTLRTERPPVRPRSGRRPLPPLIFLLVLAVAAVAVWGYVIRSEDQKVAKQQAACSTAAAAPSIAPASVSLRVYNATSTAGLATTVANALKQRGFTVGEVGNDSSGRKVTGVGELRYGQPGKEAAAFVKLFVPGAGDYPDTRATAVVDVVIGPDFKALATPDQVAAALAPAKAASASC